MPDLFPILGRFCVLYFTVFNHSSAGPECWQVTAVTVGSTGRHGVIASFELFGFTEAQCKGAIPSGLSVILHEFLVWLCVTWICQFFSNQLAHISWLREVNQVWMILGSCAGFTGEWQSPGKTRQRTRTVAPRIGAMPKAPPSPTTSPGFNLKPNISKRFSHRHDYSTFLKQDAGKGRNSEFIPFCCHYHKTHEVILFKTFQVSKMGFLTTKTLGPFISPKRCGLPSSSPYSPGMGK